MTHKVKWTCDGCDYTEETEDTAIMPSTMRCVSITVKTHALNPANDIAPTHSYDLCDSCRSHLKISTDPKTWAREAPQPVPSDLVMAS